LLIFIAVVPEKRFVSSRTTADIKRVVIAERNRKKNIKFAFSLVGGVPNVINHVGLRRNCDLKVFDIVDYLAITESRSLDSGNELLLDNAGRISDRGSSRVNVIVRDNLGHISQGCHGLHSVDKFTEVIYSADIVIIILTKKSKKLVTDLVRGV